MDGRSRVIAVGVDACPSEGSISDLHYAEEDARSVFNLLTDPEIGTFDPADGRLLTGTEASVGAVKAAVRSAALASTASDLLLVYFAGHGVMPAWSSDGDAFLACSDMDLAKQHDDPESGLRLGFLKRDVFGACAGSSILVLDCCHAGGYVDNRGAPSLHDGRTLEHVVDQMYQARMSGHSALLACPRDAAARERRDLGHGVFTDAVIRGLRGEAAGPGGEVSLESLAGYVAGLGLDPEPGRFIQGWGTTIVLTCPHPSPRPTPAPTRLLPPTPRPALDRARIDLLPNPLDPVVEPLLGLLDRAYRQPALASANRSANDPTPELLRLQQATEADAVAVLDISPSGHVDHDSTSLFRQEQMVDTLTQIGRHAETLGRDSLGLLSQTIEGLPLLVIPLASTANGSIPALVLVNPARSLLDLGEPLARTLISMWQQRSACDPLDAELEVLTSLRREFGRLPLRLYHRGLDLYRELLGRLTMVFEPVVSLNRDAGRLGVESWEALARLDESQRTAPASLLQAAAMWGDEFVIERDVILAERAITGYAAAHARSVFQHDKNHPLSINVAARSILSDAYIAQLAATLRTTDLGRGRLILEISEKDPIGPATDQLWLDDALDVFHRRLVHLAAEHHIAFAIDDFGVGHASLDRISKLTLTQIKVDRAILSHPLGLEEIRLVVQVARHNAGDRAPRDVVIEGFDSTSPIPLCDLYEAGVRLVQGYLTEEPATTELKPLGDVRTRIAAVLGARS